MNWIWMLLGLLGLLFLGGVDFGPSPAVAHLDTGIRSEVIASKDQAPKGRGARRREAAAKRGKK